jgi:hypothetical protein
MRFHHRAVPIVPAAVPIDTIGFGILVGVVPRLRPVPQLVASE